MEIKGTTHKLLTPESGTGSKAWSKQTVIIKTEGDYPKEVALSVWNDKCVIPEPGTKATFFINPESREYNGKWYTDINVWKIVPEGAKSKPVATKSTVEDDSDLPF